MSPIRSLALLVTAGFAAAFAPSVTSATPVTPPPAVEALRAPDAVGTAVVALLDTGINPYHEQFRDTSDRAQEHPSTYIDGFPSDARALRLSLDAPTYAEALAADCDLWRSVKQDELVWFPGTRIIGAISARSGNLTCRLVTEDDGTQTVAPSGAPRVLDVEGHGTMVASRAAADSFGACPTCLVVAVQSPGGGIGGLLDATPAFVDTLAWVAEQRTWIDVLSNSFAPVLATWDPTGVSGMTASSPDFVRQVEATAQAVPSFWASGNGVMGRGGVLGHPAIADPHATPSAIMVGAHDSGHVTVWHGLTPHLVSDGCAGWGAEERTMDGAGERVAGGTSSATPFVAGQAAELLAVARDLLGDLGVGHRPDGVVASGEPGLFADGPLADGVLDRDEWRRLLHVTATARPTAQYEDGPPCNGADVWDLLTPALPAKWVDVPSSFPEHLVLGYGAVDDAATEAAVDVLLGRTPLPDRPSTDAYFEQRDELGAATHELYTTP